MTKVPRCTHRVVARDENDLIDFDQDCGAEIVVQWFGEISLDHDFVMEADKDDAVGIEWSALVEWRVCCTRGHVFLMSDEPADSVPLFRSMLTKALSIYTRWDEA